jgi:alkyl hydroperoxide reductase subunit F
MLDAATREQLRVHLDLLRRPVCLVLAAGNDELDAFCAEIVSLSPLLRIESAVDAPRLGSVGLATEGPPRVWFAGPPLGHEFTSFVLAVLHVGGHPPKTDATVLGRIAALRGPLYFETYYSRSCLNCPDTVQAFNLLAALHPGIVHVAIDGGAYQEEVRARSVHTVPTTFRDGALFLQGRSSIDEVLALAAPPLDHGVSARNPVGRALDELAGEPFDVLVVGAGPAGLSAAIYAARKGMRTAVLAERLGGQLLDTAGIENYAGIAHTEGSELSRAMLQHARQYGVFMLAPYRASGLLADLDGAVSVHLESGVSLQSRSVILAPGARWRKLGVPGEEEYLRRGVTFCPHCDGPLFARRRVAVVGGGNSGIEAALDLSALAAHVDVLEYASSSRADEVLLAALRRRDNVSLHFYAETLEVLGNGTEVTGLRYKNRVSMNESVLPVDGVFVQVGLEPCTEWLVGTLDRNMRGEIIVSGRGETSLPGVFAAGDATTAPYKQISVAAGHGAAAAIAAFEYVSRK